MRDVTKRIISNWDWLKVKLDNDWNDFLLDSQKAINRFNADVNKPTKKISILNEELLNLLSQTGKVEDFVKSSRLPTNEPVSSQNDDLIQNSVDELAEKITEEKNEQSDSRQNSGDNNTE